MLFNSLGFLIFFPICVLVYYAIPKKYQYLWLLGASYWFYMNWNPLYVLLLLFSTITTYISGLMIDKYNNQNNESTLDNKKKAVAASFMINLAILFIFKYLNMTIDLTTGLFKTMGQNIGLNRVDLVLPVGISFYTFQALSYTMDVYRGDVRAEKNFAKYALFVSFFPQLVAGPIERSKNLLSQVNTEHSFDYERARDGLYLMLYGYFLKIVMADRISIVVDSVYGDYANHSGLYIVIATILFAFQIYCDFAGYSTIAMGAAKIMGFKLMENFDAPYLSRSVTEFWRRWHISLSSWFRDYLYIPLGGNRKGTARKFINVMIVFLVSGLWHGAALHFVLWGGLNGLYQVIEGITNRSKLKLNRVTSVISCITTFVLVDFAWLFFRADSISSAGSMIKRVFTSFNSSSVSDIGLSNANVIVMLIGIAILILADVCRYNKISISHKMATVPMVARCFTTALVITLIVVFGIWGAGYNPAAFIYFQF